MSSLFDRRLSVYGGGDSELVGYDKLYFRQSWNKAFVLVVWWYEIKIVSAVLVMLACMW